MWESRNLAAGRAVLHSAACRREINGPGYLTGECAHEPAWVAFFNHLVPPVFSTSWGQISGRASTFGAWKAIAAWDRGVIIPLPAGTYAIDGTFGNAFSDGVAMHSLPQHVTIPAGSTVRQDVIASIFWPPTHPSRIESRQSSRCRIRVRGDGRNRTGVDGFAGRCVATPPRRQSSRP